MSDLTVDAAVRLVSDAIQEVIREEGLEPADLDAGTDILKDTSIDSLRLAIVVLRLEDRTGKDPFEAGFIPFRTVAELATLYVG